MLVSLVVGALYAWFLFAKPTADSHLAISDFAVIAAGIAVVTALVAYKWTPPHLLRESALGVYVLLVGALATLVLTSGGLASPYLAILIAATVFSGAFGTTGLALIFVTGNGYVAWQYFTGPSSMPSLVASLLVINLPLAISFVALRSGTETKEPETDRSYHDLASELRQIAGKSDVVINAIADGVLALDGKGLIELINPAAQRLIGWGNQDALGLDYKSVLKLVDETNQSLDISRDPIVHVLTNNQTLKTEDVSIVTSSGKSFLSSIMVSPIGQIGNGVIVIFRNITSEKAEERQQFEFISTASHEMRTPVASIEGYLGLALNPHTATIDAKARDFIEKAHASAEHLGRLFQDLLDVSKADDGRLKNVPGVIDVVQFIHDIVQGLAPKAAEKNLVLTYKPMPDDGEGQNSNVHNVSPVFYSYIDRDHLREVASNLVENAIKYTPTGEIVVDVTGDESHVVLSVADTGLGIPLEDQAHLFQKFYRVDTSDTREIGGTGLGLYLARRLTETMGGRIWVESEYKKGSSFFVELPRISNEEANRIIENSSLEASQEAVATPPAPIDQPATQYQAAPDPRPSIVTQNSSAVAPQMNQPLAATPQAPSGPTRNNTPLSSIEASPDQYLRPRGDYNISVPSRPAN